MKRNISTSSSGNCSTRVFWLLKILISFAVILLTIPDNDCEAFIIDHFDKDGNSIVRRYPNREPPKPKDTSCIFLHENKILTAPADEAIKVISKMRLDRQIDLFMCAANVNITEVLKALFTILQNKLSGNIRHFTKRLEATHADTEVALLLWIYVAYGFDEVTRKAKEKDVFLDSDLPYPPELARLLVQKANDLTDPAARDFFLDYLIPLLPHDEAVAREAQREPSTWERVK